MSAISEFGLIEMTRERVRPSLIYAFSEPCPTCDGIGRVISKPAVLTRIDRWLMRFKGERKGRMLRLIVHPEMVPYLTEGFRSRIRRLMWKYWLKIDIAADSALRMDEFKFFPKGSEEEIVL
jgi:ribonuclease G